MRKVTQFAFPYVLLAVTIMLVITSITAINANENAQQNHDAICAWRASQQQQIDQTEQILRNNPEALEQFGLTVAQVRVQIHQQQASVDSLELDCD